MKKYVSPARAPFAEPIDPDGELVVVDGAASNVLWIDGDAYGFNQPVMSLRSQKKEWEEKRIGDEMMRRREQQLARLGYEEVVFYDEDRQLRAAGLTVAYLLGRVFVHKNSMDEFKTLQKMVDPSPPRRDPYADAVRSGRFSTRVDAKSAMFMQTYGASAHQLHILAGLKPGSLSLGVSSARARAEYNRKDAMMTQQLEDVGVDVGKEKSIDE